MPFSNLGLLDQLVQGVKASGYTTPTEIQSLAIPKILTGKDVIGCAQTGTGKTAAFVLPMIQLLQQSTEKRHNPVVRGLVLAPTRELALQVDEAVATYGKFSHMRSTAIFGGVNMENQIRRLQKGVDIVVATPGRLLDHMQRRTIDLSHVSILVLDEADRMFDMGFINDVRKIIARVPSKRQTLLFSATMSKEIKDLVKSVQHDAELIEVGERRRPVESVAQHFYAVPQESKMDLLFHILRTQKLDSVLVFSRTKHNADKISRRLEKGGFRSVAIHSNRSQAQRQRALAGFKQGQYHIMVATDIAARGIDVDGISHVINYDAPAFAEDYIHRIGRTGRAEATGDAITFVSNGERDNLRKIEHYVGKKHELRAFPGFDPAKKEPGAEPSRPQTHRPMTHARPHSNRSSSQSHSRPNTHRTPPQHDPERGSTHRVSPRVAAERDHPDGGHKHAQPARPYAKKGHPGGQRRTKHGNPTPKKYRTPEQTRGHGKDRSEQPATNSSDWRSLMDQSDKLSVRKRIARFFSK